MRSWRALVAAGMVAGLWSAVLPQPVGWSELDGFMRTRFHMEAEQVAAVRRGRPVTVVVPATVDREFVVAGAVRIEAPAKSTVDLVRRIEQLESGPSFLRTKRLSEPPRLEDFATFEVTQEDLSALRSCRPGRCAVKLGAGAMNELAKLDWRAPDADRKVHALARRQAFDYVQAYRRGGNRELAVYRDGDRPRFIAQEFSELVTQTAALPSALPELAEVLLTYPAVPRPRQSEEFFYWSVADFGLKPVFRINHVVIVQPSGPLSTQYAIATKQLYANHYFHTALEIRVLMDDEKQPGRAHYLLMWNMARSDGLTGLFGGVVKSKVRTASRAGLEQALRATKRLAEAGHRAQPSGDQ